MLVSHHVLPLGALGTRRGSIAHVTHAVLFRLWLECFEWSDVRKLIQNTFALVADQGTERKLGDVEHINVQDNFPWWSDARGNLFADEDPLIQEQPRPQPQRQEHDLCESGLAIAPAEYSTPQNHTLPGFISSVRIPPHFHIIDKVSNSLLGSLNLSWPGMGDASGGFFKRSCTGS